MEAALQNSIQANQTFCQEILKELLKKFSSKKQLSEKTTVSKSTVNRILSGRIANPSYYAFAKILRLYLIHCYLNKNEQVKD